MKRAFYPVLLVALAALVLVPILRAVSSPRKILFFTKSSGYEHSVISWKDGKPSVAEKALAMGKVDDAERILASPLGDVIEASRAGKKLTPHLIDMAARFSAKLATATGKGSWADYVIELYAKESRPCPALVIDELYGAIHKVSGVDMTRLRAYVTDLRSKLPSYGPADRFLFQRLEGLERLAGLR